MSGRCSCGAKPSLWRSPTRPSRFETDYETEDCMIKVTEIVKRAKGMTVEEFQDHWLHSHGPIVAEMPGLLRYAQSHTRPGGYRRGEPAYDGIAELWFQDKEALRSIATTDEFAAAKS